MWVSMAKWKWKISITKNYCWIYPPTRGEILVTGKINNLLNIGFGFNSEAQEERT